MSVGLNRVEEEETGVTPTVEQSQTKGRRRWLPNFSLPQDIYRVQEKPKRNMPKRTTTSGNVVIYVLTVLYCFGWVACGRRLYSGRFNKGVQIHSPVTYLSLCFFKVGDPQTGRHTCMYIHTRLFYSPCGDQTIFLLLLSL